MPARSESDFAAADKFQLCAIIRPIDRAGRWSPTIFGASRCDRKTREADMIKRNRKLVSGVALVGSVIALGIGQAILQDKAEAQRPMVQAPVFEVDPLWPKPTGGLLLGQTIGLWADEQDH